MVQEPIKIKDYVNPVESARQLLMNETNNKDMAKTKGFIFKGYKTEKERIVKQ